MSQASYTISNGAGSAVRSAINLILAAIKSNNSDASTFPTSPSQGESFSQLLSATQQLEWRYDGTQWVLERIIDPTNHEVYPAGIRQISGLTLSNNGSDATNDIDIAAGWTGAEEAGVPLILLSALTKRLDAAWTVGTNQGGLDTGSIANATYHVWLIRRSDTGVVDVLFSTSASAPTMPANYDQKRRIGSILRESAAIVGFSQDGDEFLRKVPKQDISASNPGTSAVTAVLSVPTGIVVRADIEASLYDNTVASQTYGWVSSLVQTDATPNATNFNLRLVGSGTQIHSHAPLKVRTDTSAQIRYRIDQSTADHSVIIITHGWIDRRGQDA